MAPSNVSIATTLPLSEHVKYIIPPGSTFFSRQNQLATWDSEMTEHSCTAPSSKASKHPPPLAVSCSGAREEDLHSKTLACPVGKFVKPPIGAVVAVLLTVDGEPADRRVPLKCSGGRVMPY